MKTGRLLKKIASVFALLLLLAGAGLGEDEDFIPPSPEPPAAGGRERPTPEPTAKPDIDVINHIHFPREYADFSFGKDSKLLEIWFPNIKDADEAILIYDGEVCLIDCGDEHAGARGTLLLRQLGVTAIDTIYCSHLHHDHINGLAVTDQTAKVREVRICFDPDTTESGLLMEQTAKERGITISRYRSGDRFTMGGDGAVTLWFIRNEDPEMDMNNQSAMTKVTYGERSILFTADVEKDGQAELAQNADPSFFSCDIVKYPHHAKNAMAEPFFALLGAKLTVITSVQGRADYGQQYVVAKRLPAAYTLVKGKCIHLATDGEYWLCEYIPLNINENVDKAGKQ